MKKPEYEELETELLNNKLFLLDRYLKMLDSDSNHDKDELTLLDEFYSFFTIHAQKHNNYLEYMIFLRSYILLSHAAIEEFIEQTIKYYFLTSVDKYKKDKTINSILKWFILKSDFNNSFDSKGFTEIVVSLEKNYFKTINDNHGIKKHNLIKMFSKIGIDNLSYEVFDKLGQMRGAFAHHNGKSAHLSLKIPQPLNPQDCVKMVEDVILTIKDEILVSLDSAIK